MTKRRLVLIGILSVTLLIIAIMVGLTLWSFVSDRAHDQESIYRACIMRFRPILMTTMAALLGGVPLMLGTGTGSEIRQPLGYAIVGGLALSQVLTLYTTPVVFLYLDRFIRRSHSPRPTNGDAALQPASKHQAAE